MKKNASRTPKRSLRTILVLWFLLLSIVPLAFLTGFSVMKYEEAIDNEMVQRLRLNVREFEEFIQEYKKYLSVRQQKHQQDTALVYNLTANSVSMAKNVLASSIRNSLVTKASLFNQSGRMIATLTPENLTNSKDDRSLEEFEIFLNAADLAELTNKSEIFVLESGENSNAMNLICLAKLKSRSGKTVGYIEETITLSQTFLEGLKKRYNNLEFILFDSKGKVVNSSHSDFREYPKDYFAKSILGSAETFFELTLRDEPFGFIIAPIDWGGSRFLIGLGTSKQRARKVLNSVNYAFFSVSGAIFVLLILSSFLIARQILRPLNDLVWAIQRTGDREGAIEVPVTSDTELGILAESFNEMSQRVVDAKTDLQKKVDELERAYAELKETQSRLVHSAKMASLGQLVAGVAHELNNPIGFIYSNMSHLREYSLEYQKLIQAAEQGPEALAKAKEECDFEYMQKDLPRLIQSCEDGARRTKDIVVGLRNFSRLDEGKFKKMNINESLDQTIRLLSGEFKGQVELHTEFTEVPEVECQAGHINQVFVNIISNAVQSIQGKGDVFIRTRVGPQGATGPTVEISIRDTGHGIDRDTLERIFDPFFTTKAVGEGTGLGLSISYGIVKKHGGEIRVSSEVGKGTEFTIVLPVNRVDHL